MRIRFSQSARRHRIGKASAMHVIENVEPLVTESERGVELYWLGQDERGRELEIVAVTSERDGALLIIHVMPARFRKR